MTYGDPYNYGQMFDQIRKAYDTQVSRDFARSFFNPPKPTADEGTVDLKGSTIYGTIKLAPGVSGFKNAWPTISVNTYGNTITTSSAVRNYFTNDPIKEEKPVFTTTTVETIKGWVGQVKYGVKIVHETRPYKKSHKAYAAARAAEASAVAGLFK